MTCQNVSCGKKNYIPQPPLKVKCGEGQETPDTISKIQYTPAELFFYLVLHYIFVVPS